MDTMYCLCCSCVLLRSSEVLLALPFQAVKAGLAPADVHQPLENAVYITVRTAALLACFALEWAASNCMGCPWMTHF